MKRTTRPAVASDIQKFKHVLDNCELFPSEYLEDMIAPFFNNSESEDFWFTTVENDKVVSLAFCAPMAFTNGTFNLYAIGVHNDHQGMGIGKEMMTYLEKKLKADGRRILIVETSGTDARALTRKFYIKNGYTKEAVLRDFWDEGDDKVIFWKKL